MFGGIWDRKQQRIAYVAEELLNAFYRLNGAGNHLLTGRLYAPFFANGDAGHGGGRVVKCLGSAGGVGDPHPRLDDERPGGASYRCTSGTNRFAAKIVAPGAMDLGNKIYSTNVPGIGMRFSRGGATVNIVYPDVFSSRVSSTTNYSLEGSRFACEIIKTAATTGSGHPGDGKIHLL